MATDNTFKNIGGLFNSGLKALGGDGFTLEEISTGADFFKSLYGNAQLQESRELADQAFGATMNGIADGRAAAMRGYQFNSAVEMENMATQLRAITAHKDQVLELQQESMAGRGVNSGVSRLMFISETMSSAEKAVTDIRSQSRNRRLADKMELTNVLNELRSKEQAAKITRAQQRQNERQKQTSGIGELISAGSSLFSLFA